MAIFTADKSDEISSCSADEWNKIFTDIGNLINGFGVNQTNGDLNQLGKAIATYVSSGNFYTAITDPLNNNQYILSKQSGFQPPFEYTDGMEIGFIAPSSNTSAVTINVAGLGTEDVKSEDGSDLGAGDININKFIRLRYKVVDVNTSYFVASFIGEATATSKGLDFGANAPVLKISNNATNPTTEIDLSAGVMRPDDGSPSVIFPNTITKSTANDFANGGLLPNGTVLQTDTMYYVFAIYSSASNLVSFYADTSKTNPTLPQSPNTYDKKQLRGAFYVGLSGDIALGDYECTEDYCEFDLKNEIPTSLSSSSTTAVDVLVKAPANSKITANLQTRINASVTVIKRVRVYPTTSNDDTVDDFNSQAIAQRNGNAFESNGNSQIKVKCDSNSRVRVRSNSSSSNSTTLTLVGWRLKLKD